MQYKTAFVLAHKLREAVGAADKGKKVSGEVEIDGMYTGGHVRPANYKQDRKDRRLAENQKACAQGTMPACPLLETLARPG